MLLHVRPPQKTATTSMWLATGCWNLHNRVPPCPTRGVIYRQHGRGQVAMPGLPAPGFPDMCGCDQRPGKHPYLPWASHQRFTSPAEPRHGVILRPEYCCRFCALHRTTPSDWASFRAAAMLASSSERSGNSDRREDQVFLFGRPGQTGC